MAVLSCDHVMTAVMIAETDTIELSNMKQYVCYLEHKGLSRRTCQSTISSDRSSRALGTLCSSQVTRRRNHYEMLSFTEDAYSEGVIPIQRLNDLEKC